MQESLFDKVEDYQLAGTPENSYDQSLFNNRFR